MQIVFEERRPVIASFFSGPPLPADRRYSLVDRALISGVLCNCAQSRCYLNVGAALKLYALILSPTMCSIAHFASPSADNSKSSATNGCEWRAPPPRRIPELAG